MACITHQMMIKKEVSIISITKMSIREKIAQMKFVPEQETRLVTT
jgi:hypothetical protein